MKVRGRLHRDDPLGAAYRFARRARRSASQALGRTFRGAGTRAGEVVVGPGPGPRSGLAPGTVNDLTHGRVAASAPPLAAHPNRGPFSLAERQPQRSSPGAATLPCRGSQGEYVVRQHHHAARSPGELPMSRLQSRFGRWSRARRAATGRRRDDRPALGSCEPRAMLSLPGLMRPTSIAGPAVSPGPAAISYTTDRTTAAVISRAAIAASPDAGAGLPPRRGSRHSTPLSHFRSLFPLEGR